MYKNITKADEIHSKNSPRVSTDGGSLYVSCFEIINVKDKTTFDSLNFNGVNVTFWMDDEADVQSVVDGMFDALFNEVVKSGYQINNGAFNNN